MTMMNDEFGMMRADVGRDFIPTNDTIISDEALNELADWFLKSRCGTILDITFLEYLSNTDYYDDLFDAVQMGAALTRLPDGRQEIIGNHGIIGRIN